MHGYEMIQELEERTDGVWRPSPGAVYPALQLLEDQGLVTADAEAGKRLFSLTDTGREEAAKAGDRKPWDDVTEGIDPTQFKLRDSLGPIAMAARQVAMRRHARAAGGGGRDPRRHLAQALRAAGRSDPTTPAPADRARPARSPRAGRRRRATMLPRPGAGACAWPASGSGTGTTRAGAARVEHPEVPVSARRGPRLGVEHQVVVGQLDRADPPSGQGLRHRDLELAHRALLVEPAHPRVGDRGQRVGVVHEVGRVRARVACVHAATARSSGGSSASTDDRRRRSPPGRAARRTRSRPSPTTATTVVVGALGRAVAPARRLRTAAGRAARRPAARRGRSRRTRRPGSSRTPSPAA